MQDPVGKKGNMEGMIGKYGRNDREIGIVDALVDGQTRENIVFIRKVEERKGKKEKKINHAPE